MTAANFGGKYIAVLGAACTRHPILMYTAPCLSLRAMQRNRNPNEITYHLSQLLTILPKILCVCARDTETETLEIIIIIICDEGQPSHEYSTYRKWATINIHLHNTTTTGRGTAPIPITSLLALVHSSSKLRQHGHQLLLHNYSSLRRKASCYWYNLACYLESIYRLEVGLRLQRAYWHRA